MIPGSVKLEATWRTRYESVRAPVLMLDRWGQAQAASDSPIPAAYQTGFPPDFFAQLPDVCGRYPLGPFLPRYERAIAAGIDIESGEIPELDWTPPAPEAVPVLAIINPARHTTFNLTVPDGVDTPLVPADRWCTYILIVNNGANDARIAYDQSSIGGLLLTSGGGFHELQAGTQSSVRASGDGGATELTVTLGRANPARACRLPCESTA